MEITLEQIDLLRKRANINYKEAKEALENCNGNMIEALAYLEEHGQLKPEIKPFRTSSFFKKIKNIILKLNKTYLVISKNNKTILNVSLIVAIFFSVLSIHLPIVAIILTLITGCKIKLKKNNGDEYGINSEIEKISDTVGVFTNKVTQEIKKL